MVGGLFYVVGAQEGSSRLTERIFWGDKKKDEGPDGTENREVRL